MKAKNARMGLVGAGVAALGLSLIVAPSVGAQDDAMSFGAGIYEGTCDSPGDRAVFDIGDLEADDDDNNGTLAGTPVSGPVYSEDEGLSATLDDLTGQPRVVLVLASEDANAPAVACGEITGEPDGDHLSVDLEPVDDSGVSGVATFGPPEPGDDDGDRSEVEVQVRADGGMVGTPSA